MSETKNKIKEAKNKDNQSELNTLMNNANDNDIEQASQKDTQVYEREYDDENFKDGQITAGLIYLLSIIYLLINKKNSLYQNYIFKHQNMLLY